MSMRVLIAEAHSLLLQCQPLMELWTLPGVRFGFCCGTPILRQDVGIER